MEIPQVDQLADVLVNYSLAVKPGDRVALSGSTLAEPLLKALTKHVLLAGGHPLLLPRLPGVAEIIHRYASDEQLQHVPETAMLVFETYEAYIEIMSVDNTKAMSNVDPARIALQRSAQRGILQTAIQRMASGDLRWVGTLYPNNAHAQDAEMSLSEYEEFVFSACLPDMDDPVGYWRRFSARQQAVVDWLRGKERVHVVAPGTDLRLSIAGRTFVNCDGHENMPDGEVFTGPVEDSVEGYVHFSYPTVFGGREVNGVRLRFEQGRVVEATATKNEEYLLQMLDSDDGARYVGEFAIGNNAGITRFTGNTLFDEKIYGSFHIALGMSLPETGGQNKSAIHWDMVNDLRTGEIWVDDELLYKDGQFAIEF